MDRRDDRKLVRAARHGDRDAAAELFRRHWPAAWRAAYGVTGRRAMADDIAADAFERAFAALERFDERRPFLPWLHRIVVNRALDLLRAERRLVGGEAPPNRRTFRPITARVTGLSWRRWRCCRSSGAWSWCSATGSA